MSVDTPAAPPAERSHDRTLLAGARHLGAWGPGLLRKQEGLWRTPAGVFVVGERAEGDERVSYRVVEEAEAVTLLREHGHAWRAGQIERKSAAEAEAEAAAAETAAQAPAEGEEPAEG